MLDFLAVHVALLILFSLGKFNLCKKKKGDFYGFI